MIRNDAINTANLSLIAEMLTRSALASRICRLTPANRERVGLKALPAIDDEQLRYYPASTPG